MVRYAMIVLAIALADGVRLVKRRGDPSEVIAGSRARSSNLDEQAEAAEEATTNDALAAELSSGPLKRRVNATLKELDTDWKNATKAGTDLLNEIAGMDWRANIGEQMKQIAKKSALKGAHFIASAVHPLLGVVFSLMSSLFGWGGAAGSNMAEQILEEVDRMIKDAVAELKRDFVGLEVRGVMDTIDHAGTDKEEWKLIPSLMSDKFVKVFGAACWDTPATTKCRNWRSTDSGGAHLLLELKFMELMVLTGTTLMEYGRNFEGFAELIKLGANRTLGHYNVFQGYRLNFQHVKKGSVVCGGRMNKRTCGITPGRDNVLDRDVCARGRAAVSQESMQNWLDTCHSNYVADIRDNMKNKIKPEVDAVYKAAISLGKGERARRR